jgi:hypothetical protein
VARRSQGRRDEAALRSAGQRDTSLLWETTQMKIALSVIWGSLTLARILGAFGKWLGSENTQLASLVFLYGVANLVTGFYFGRTNHTRTGGPGGDDAGRR